MTEPRVVLEARIVAGPGGSFAVEIDDSAAVLPEEETFRFALHYYGRVLFELVRAERSVRRLPAWTAAVAARAIDRDADVFRLAGVGGALVRSVSAIEAEIRVEMRTSGARDRELHGEITMRGTMLARSVLAVIQSVLPRLSPAMRDAMPVALANMNASYELTHRYADPASQREVPVLAYLAASFV